MDAEQLIRSLTVACKLAKLDDEHAAVLVSPDLGGAADLLCMLLDVVEQRASGEVTPAPDLAPIAIGPHGVDRVSVVRELAAAGCTDPEIGSALGVSRWTVAAIRRRNGIAAGVTPAEAARARRTGWEERVLAILDQPGGATAAEVAEEMDWTVGTAYTRISQLRRRGF